VRTQIDHDKYLRLAVSDENTPAVWLARAHVDVCAECTAQVRRFSAVARELRGGVPVIAGQTAVREAIEQTSVVTLRDRWGDILARLSREVGQTVTEVVGLRGGHLLSPQVSAAMLGSADTRGVTGTLPTPRPDDVDDVSSEPMPAKVAVELPGGLVGLTVWVDDRQTAAPALRLQMHEPLHLDGLPGWRVAAHLDAQYWDAPPTDAQGETWLPLSNAATTTLWDALRLAPDTVVWDVQPPADSSELADLLAGARRGADRQARVRAARTRGGLTTVGDTREGAEEAFHAGVLRILAGDWAGALVSLEEAHAAFERLGDAEGAARCAQNLGVIAQASGHEHADDTASVPARAPHASRPTPALALIAGQSEPRRPIMARRRHQQGLVAASAVSAAAGAMIYDVRAPRLTITITVTVTEERTGGAHKLRADLEGTMDPSTPGPSSLVGAVARLKRYGDLVGDTEIDADGGITFSSLERGVYTLEVDLPRSAHTILMQRIEV